MIEALLEQADRLAAGEQPAKARDLYAQICQLAPHRACYWLRLAELQYQLEQFGDGLRALEYALRLEPRNPAALLLASATLLETGGYAQAAQLAERVQHLEGGNRLAALLNQSMALLRLGQFTEALAAADAALTLDENQPVAHSTRGSALFSLGRHEEALAALDRTLALRPKHAPALINRAAVLRAMRRPAEALADVDTVLTEHPESLAALLNRAAALLDLERPEEALAALDRLLVRQPNHAKALLNCTLALLQLGRYPEALTIIQALRSAGQPVVGVLLAATETLLRQNRSVQALTWIDQGLVWHPDHPELLRGRIAVLLAQERYRSALAVAERLLAVTEPHRVAERLAVAAALNANGRFQDALAVLEQLPPAAQDDWQFHAKSGEALAVLGRSAEACAAFAAADRLNARAFRASYHDGPFQCRPADSLPPPVTPELIQVNFEFRRLEHGDWQDYDRRIAAIQQWTEASLTGGARSPLLPFRALFLPLSPVLRLAIARREAEWIAGTVAELTATGGRGSATPVAQEPARLKIGYVSADFREHPTAHLMRSLFRCHDRRRFEIYVYSLHSDDGSAYYRQIRDDSDQFVDLSSMDNAAAVRRIQTDEVSILVDLMAYTNFARPEIFARRPAPIQVNWLGFPGSSGAGYMDYLLADPVVLPADQAAFCTEQPAWLPECYQVNDRWQNIAETSVRRADHGLPDQGFVFCSFNQMQKLEPVLFAVWMRILGQTPGSVLWLHTHSEEAPEHLRAEAARHGIADERLMFAERLPKAQHLERHRLADLFLDTRIYNAHTTASDALWAGVPVLTCIGEAFPARVAASLLRAIGLPELITHSLEEYESLAVRLATRPAELAGLRAKLADHRLRMPLFDTERFARHLERAYELMWERHVQGLPPAPLHIPALPAMPD
ncbi:MAG TPA: tetratricopeptide repeat protein [Candidatus Competibacteraceae bacterium]|nr:tetratricopeptide repeat protein [Candidatus Competibacteraceae bacterium]HRZ06461.1 tetratricopeptide repeat protein [Candidatus Competibacteraceae bacterium]HSA45136.1 tetratricopeptide repeat protein [Candidatus Competibacteraceae bacterium]